MGRRRTIEDAEILEVARRVFQKHGHSASTRDVALAAGISQAVLYQRFETKDDLFFAAMMPQPPDLEALLGAGDEVEGSALSYLCGVGRRLLGYFASAAPAMLHLITHPAFQQSMGRAHEHLLAGGLLGELAGRVKWLQDRGLVGAADPVVAAEALIAAVHSIAIFRAMLGERVSPADGDRVEQVVRTLWKGLEPR